MDINDVKKGAKVRIHNFPKHLKEDVGWVEPMDGWVGKTGILMRDKGDVFCAYQHRIVRVSNEKGTDSWNFPLACLQLIEEDEKPITLEAYERF